MSAVVHLVVLAAQATPDPAEPTLRPGLEPTDVTPGLAGFLVTFALALVLVGLLLSLTRKLRRVRVRGGAPTPSGLPVEDGPVADPADPAAVDRDVAVDPSGVAGAADPADTADPAGGPGRRPR